MMRPFGLPRCVARWIGQVAASLGATLAAAAIYAAVPSRGPATPQPELTSGGKFAARIAVPVAYDGLDTMPAPRVVPIDLPAADTPVARRAALAGAMPPAGSVARTLRPARQAARAEPRRAARPLPEVRIVVAVGAGPEPEPGWVSRGVSAASEAVLGVWSATASAGDAVASRVVPRWP